jgi:hypothetical protein
VYGAIRGRALAGLNGNSKARIFCSRAEPELLAIDGFYRTAEDFDASLHGRAIRCGSMATHCGLLQWIETTTLGAICHQAPQPVAGINR